MKEQDSIRTVKGIGEKTEKLLGKLGIFTVGDFLRYYPRDYDEYQEPVSVSRILPGKKTAVIARLSGNIGVKNTGRITVITASAREGESILWLTWFNMPFLRNTLRPGGIYIFRGTVVEKRGKRIMEHPEIFTPAQYGELEGRLQPVYALTAGLSGKTVARAVRQALKKGCSGEYLSEEIRAEYGLCGLSEALENIHFPENRQALEAARRRLVFDEFLLFLLER